jgi:hypothetical protein
VIWSISESKTFRRCQRQWYFKNCVANANAKKDPLRREAYLLSKLQSISGWRGQIVDTTITEVLVPALRARRCLMLSEAKRAAKVFFDRQLDCARRHRLREPGMKSTELGNDFAAFFCVEYGGDVNEHEIQTAWTEIERALENLFSMRGLSELLKAASYMVPQRALMFQHSGLTVRAVPDLIAFYDNRAPLIVDWKVHAFGVQEAWQQLCTYAIALTRCRPHTDFPASLGRWTATDVEVAEVQLLKNQIRQAIPSKEDIENADAYIAESVSLIALTMDGHERGELRPEDFLTTSYPETCQKCCYRSLCWESGHEPN